MYMGSPYVDAGEGLSYSSDRVDSWMCVLLSTKKLGLVWLHLTKIVFLLNDSVSREGIFINHHFTKFLSHFD